MKNPSAGKLPNAASLLYGAKPTPFTLAAAMPASAPAAAKPGAHAARVVPVPLKSAAPAAARPVAPTPLSAKNAAPAPLAAGPAASVAAPAPLTASPAASVAAPAPLTAGPAASVAAPAPLAAGPAVPASPSANAAVPTQAVQAQEQEAEAEKAAGKSAAPKAAQIASGAPPAGGGRQPAAGASQNPPRPAPIPALAPLRAFVNLVDAQTLPGDTAPDSPLLPLYMDLSEYLSLLEGQSAPSYLRLKELLGRIESGALSYARTSVPSAQKDVFAQRLTALDAIRTQVVPAERARLMPDIQALELRVVPDVGPNSEGEVNVRHLMNFHLRIKYPDHPVKYDDGSLGGIYFQYWEEIVQFYKFNEPLATHVAQKKRDHEGARVKPWNDIFAIVPSSVTFSPGNDKTSPLRTALDEQYDEPADSVFSLPAFRNAAASSGVSGMQNLYFVDRPGVSISKYDYKHRQLNFRITAFNAAGQRKELLCNQTLQADDGQILAQQMRLGPGGAGVSASFGDTRGAKPSAAARKGGPDPTFLWGKNIPPDALEAAVPFVQMALAGTAAPFDQYEFNEARIALADRPDIDKSSIPKQVVGQAGVPDADRAELYRDANSPYSAVVRAAASGAGGVGLAVPHPGYFYYEHSFGAGHKLVAVVSGGQLLHLYYTNGTFIAPEANVKIGGTEVAYKYYMRNFEEIPTQYYYDQMQRVPVQTAGYAHSSANSKKLAREAATAIYGTAVPTPAEVHRKGLSADEFSPVDLRLFDNRRGRPVSDPQFKELKSLAAAYNQALATPGADIISARGALELAAGEYIAADAFSESSHPDLQERVCRLMLQLSSTKGAAERALQTLDSLREQSGQQLISDKGREGGNTLDRARYDTASRFFETAISGGSVGRVGRNAPMRYRHSDAMRAAVLSTFSMLDTVSVGAGQSMAPVRFGVEGGTGGKTDVDLDNTGAKTLVVHNTAIENGTDPSMRGRHEYIGTFVHEMTHAADAIAYQNTVTTLGISPEARAQDVEKEILRRQRLMDSLFAKYTDLSESDMTTVKARGVDVDNLVDRLTYGSGYSNQIADKVSWTDVGNLVTRLQKDVENEALPPERREVAKRCMDELIALNSWRYQMAYGKHMEAAKQIEATVMESHLQVLRNALAHASSTEEKIKILFAASGSNYRPNAESTLKAYEAGKDGALVSYMRPYYTKDVHEEDTRLLRTKERSLTFLTEFDAVMPQLLCWMELRGEREKYPELYNKIRAIVMLVQSQRMAAYEKRVLGNKAQKAQNPWQADPAAVIAQFRSVVPVTAPKSAPAHKPAPAPGAAAAPQSAPASASSSTPTPASAQ